MLPITEAEKQSVLPPAKLACLACRASKTRCNGEKPCPGCLIRRRECCYINSKRGGSRKTQAPRASIEVKRTSVDHASDLAALAHIGHLISPGAGLRRPDVEGGRQARECILPTTTAVTGQLVRIYGGEEAIEVTDEERLNAYYILIHHNFPILPPPALPVTLDCPLDWPLATAGSPLPHGSTSPLSLALSAILALVPLPQGSPGLSSQSVSFRGSVAQRFAKAALESIDADAEFLDFTSSRRHLGLMAVDQEQSIPRAQFHPQVPVELESILALLLLSNYEHSHRGNLLKMTARAGQALITAKNMSLHRLGPEPDDFSEARRRAWWMTYFCVHLCSVVRQSASIGIDDDDNFTTPYPSLEADPEAWTILMESLRISVASVQLASNCSPFLRSQADMSSVHDQMAELDRRIVQVAARVGDPPATPSGAAMEPKYELATANTVRCLSRIRLCSARIRVHRYRAFSDIPLFMKNHCDLEVFDNSSAGAASPLLDLSPFTCDQSAEICVESALTIVRQLQSLPPPSSLYTGMTTTPTMPTCSCCVMQASYVLLMQFYKLNVMLETPSFTLPVGPYGGADRLAEELRHGLEGAIAGMGRFAAAFDAVGGMKGYLKADNPVWTIPDEVNVAFQVAFPSHALLTD